MTYSEQDVNAAIDRVETARQNHPIGWRFLAELGLNPADSYVVYAFRNADVHGPRLADEDLRLVYAAAWLNGLAVGVALGRGEDAAG